MSHDRHILPVDGHVHFHDVGRVSLTLDAAAKNFRAVGDRPAGLLGALLLTQAASERVFETLQESPMAGAWRVSLASDEPETLIAQRDDEAIAIVCGRQVRAADGLEVLALGTLEAFPDGLPFPDALEAVRSSGALAALPWGFGKWLGIRGERVEAMLESTGPEVLFVGDNGGRVDALGMPAIIRQAASRGFRILPGTDPFPFGSDHRRVGTFGFLAEVEVPEAAPWRALRGWLEGRQQSPEPYGAAIGMVRFVANQLRIRVWNRPRSA